MLPLPSGSRGGMPLVDAFLHEPGTHELAERVRDDQGRGDRQRPAVRSHEDAEQATAPAAQDPGEAGTEILDVFGGDAAPRIHLRIAGEVEGSFGIDIRDVVGFGHRASARPAIARASSSAAWLRIAA